MKRTIEIATKETFEHLRREYNRLLQKHDHLLATIELELPAVFPPGAVRPLTFRSDLLESLGNTELVELYHFAMNAFSENSASANLSAIAIARSAEYELGRRDKSELLEQ